MDGGTNVLSDRAHKKRTNNCDIAPSYIIMQQVGDLDCSKAEALPCGRFPALAYSAAFSIGRTQMFPPGWNLTVGFGLGQ